MLSNDATAPTALCLTQFVKYPYSLVGAMRFTLNATDQMTALLLDAMREVFTQSCRHYEFHANRC